MGLFDKRKKGGDDFDSPIENIDLSAPQADPAPSHAPARAAGPTLRDPDPGPPDEIEMDAPAYGIDDAIQLMRALPADNIELVVQVVKRTLESTHVKTGTIIEDATRKQNDIEGRIAVLKKDIAEYEKEISTRRGEITRLEADHKETSLVKEHLQLAEKLSTKPAARAPSTTNPPPAGLTAPSPAAPARRPGSTLPPPGASSSSSSGGGITSSSTSNTASGTAGGSTQTTAKGTTIVAKK